jgi:hypothetical protein
VRISHIVRPARREAVVSLPATLRSVRITSKSEAKWRLT